jgi:hypothetical protein
MQRWGCGGVRGILGVGWGGGRRKGEARESRRRGVEVDVRMLARTYEDG